MEKILEVRNMFEAKIKQGIPNPPGEFDHRDLERVNSDKYIKRILDHCENNVKSATKMLWDILIWRKQNNVYNIKEQVNIDCLKSGIFFPHGRDKDGSLLFITKWKLYNKGQMNTEELKKVIIYWLERMEKKEDGHPISLFLDMNECGVRNMDIDLVMYLVSLLKNYYPMFVNYSIIFQMPWIMSAGFKLIKGLFPAKAVERFRFTTKDSLKDLVAPDQALVCWGGNDPYVFEFVPDDAE
ncbi:motile sperm domain-containing protein 2 [Papilio machaon]|uniref:motile sperm domain-containing protein 2 n=1 Tax=Papilio machaon TaxID=76193 RepID=UPI001E665D5C|nr:motile sperm domain-containing protein 2 [Papilio machaon]